MSGGHALGYHVGRDGSVFSVGANWRGYGKRLMRWSANDDGYASVRLTIDGKRKRLAVHSLVAAAYLPPRPSARHQIRHLDGNRWNPSADNLVWGTAKQNADDRERHGRTSRGEAHAAAIKAGLETRHA